MASFGLLLLAIVAAGHAAASAGIRPRVLGSLELVESLWLRLVLGFQLVTAWGIGLAWFDLFSFRALIAGPAVLFFLWLPGALFGREGAGRRRLDPLAATVVIAMVLLGALIYFPPVDVRLEARDPGVYFLAGTQLVESGGLDWRDPLVEEMGAEERAWFFPPPSRHAINESYRFIGFYLEELDTARVIPQALPVLPAWIAAGRAVGGVDGGLAATGVLAVLASVSVYFLGRRLFGRWAAAGGALLLAGSWIQAWFARYGAAEIPAQLLLAAGFYGWTLFRRHRDPGFGWMAALGIGLALLTKAESVLLLGPVAAVLVADAAFGRLGRREWTSFWLPLGGIVVAGFAYARLELWPYYYDLLQQAGIRPPTFLLLTVGAVTSLIAAGLLLPRLQRSLAPLRRTLLEGGGPVGRAIGLLGAVGLLLGAGWAYFVRPVVYEEIVRQTRILQGGWNAYNVIELGWAVSVPALLLALLGCSALLIGRGRLRRGAGPFAWVGLTLAVPLVVHRQIQPLLPWAYRRWLPLILPFFWLVAARMVELAARWLGSRLGGGDRRRAGAVTVLAAIALAAPVVLHQFEFGMAYRRVDEMPGVEQILEELTTITEEGSLLLFEPRTIRGLPRFEAALQIEHDRRVLRLPEGEIRTDHVTNLVRRMARRGVASYLVTTGYLDGLTEPAAERLHEFRWNTRRLREHETYLRYARGYPRRGPLESEELFFRGRIYRLRPGGELSALDGRLDVGEWDDLYLAGDELHEAEADAEGRTYRWSKGRAGFLLPGLDEARTIVLVADPDTPPRLAPQRLTVRLDGLLLGDVELVDGWREYRFEIPGSWSDDSAPGPPRLALEVDPFFRPSDVIVGSGDTRYIGVKIDEVRWEAADPPAR